MSDERPDDAPRRGRGRPRRTESDSGIVDAALALLHDVPYASLTLDQIATKAGVAKTTIYRRWPSKAALAAEVVRRETPVLAADADVATIIRAFTVLLHGDLGRVVRSLVGEAQESDDARAIVQSLIAPYRDAIAAKTNAFTADVLLGAFWSRMLIDGTKIDEELVAAVIAQVPVVTSGAASS
jgi:AcrR family transcriptional regulator